MRVRPAPRGGENRTKQDQWEPERQSSGEGLAEYHQPQEEGDGGVEVRDDRRPRRPHLGNERKEEHEGQRSADERERNHGETHLQANLTGDPGEGKGCVTEARECHRDADHSEAGRSERRRLTMRGPNAYPSATIPISPSAR